MRLQATRNKAQRIRYKNQIQEYTYLPFPVAGSHFPVYCSLFIVARLQFRDRARVITNADDSLAPRHSHLAILFLLTGIKCCVVSVESEKFIVSSLLNDLAFVQHDYFVKMEKRKNTMGYDDRSFVL